MEGLLGNKYLRGVLNEITAKDKAQGSISHGFEHAFAVSAYIRTLCNLLSVSDSEASGCAFVHDVSYVEDGNFDHAKRSAELLRENEIELTDRLINAVENHNNPEMYNDYVVAIFAIANVIDIAKERLGEDYQGPKENLDLMQNIKRVEIAADMNVITIEFKTDGETTIKNYERLFTTCKAAFKYLSCEYDLLLDGKSML